MLDYIDDYPFSTENKEEVLEFILQKLGDNLDRYDVNHDIKYMKKSRC